MPTHALGNGESMSDDDWSTAEIVRNIKRIDLTLQSCVTEKFYLAAQSENGKRHEANERRITTIENERSTGRTSRTGVYLAAALSTATGFAFLILQLVAK